MLHAFQVKKRSLTGALMLTAILVTFAFTVASASAVLLDTNYEVEFIGVTNGGLTWHYRLSCYAPPGISHWVITWCGGGATISAASHSYEYVGDPTTGVWGIKFIFSAIDEGEYEDFWFTLDAVYPSALVPTTIKAGTNVYIGVITGPLVSSGVFTVLAEAVDVAAADDPPNWLGWRIKATATTSGTTPPIGKVVFKWYGPFAPGTAGLDPAKFKWEYEVTGSSPFEDWYRQDVDSLDVDSYHATGLLAYDDLGEWYVEAWFYAEPEEEEYYLKGFASDTVDISGVPEFSSLALVLLAAIGGVMLLKRRGSLNFPVLS